MYAALFCHVQQSCRVHYWRDIGRVTLQTLRYRMSNKRKRCAYMIQQAAAALNCNTPWVITCLCYAHNCKALHRHMHRHSPVGFAGQQSRSAKQVSTAGQHSRSAKQVSKAGQHSRSAKQVISSVFWCCSPVSCCRRGPSSDPSLAMDRAIRGSPPSSMCHPVAITGSTYLHGHDW